MDRKGLPLRLEPRTFNKYSTDRGWTELPVQYLCYAERKNINVSYTLLGGLTHINWFGLLTLSTCKFEASGSDRYKLDGWIDMKMSPTQAAIIQDFKKVINAYMNYVLTRDQATVEDPEFKTLVNEFVAKFIKLLGDSTEGVDESAEAPVMTKAMADLLSVVNSDRFLESSHKEAPLVNSSF